MAVEEVARPVRRVSGQPPKRGFGEKIVAHRTPDTGWAWVVAIACFTLNGLVFGVYRTYGVLFVALLKTYGVSRESASWPFSLCLTVMHMTGLLSGALSSYFSTRSICVCGCLIASMGITLCYFSTSVIHVGILIGIVKGFGLGLISTQTPVIINQYFDKYRATASGIALAGGTVGSFLFPPLVKIILFEYSLHGCFLILGGILLNTIPVAMLLRPPIAGDVSVETASLESDENDVDAEKRICLLQEDRDIVLQRVKLMSISEEKKLFPKYPFELTRAMILSREQKEEKLAKSSIGQLLDKKAHLKAPSMSHLEMPCPCDNCSSRGSSVFVSKPSTFVQKFAAALRANAIIIAGLLRNPLFIILSSTQIAFTWGWTTYSMVIVDFAVDRGVGISEAVVLLSAFSITDLIGRLGSGWISDKGIIKRRNVAFSSILSIGILLWMVPISASFPVLFGLALLLGLCSGSIMILFSILLVEYVGIKTMPVALGASTFMCGIATLFRPKIIGYFRDVHGSYDGLFHFLGMVCMLIAILWLVEPCAQLWQERKERLTKSWTKAPLAPNGPPVA